MTTHRVLHVTPWFPSHPSDGAVNFIYHAIEAVIAEGHKVAVLVVRPWTPRFFGLLRREWRRPSVAVESFDSALNIRTRHFPRFPRFLFSELSAGMYRWATDGVIRDMVREHRIDIIHAHTEWTGHGAVEVGRALGVPVVVTLHAADKTPAVLNSARKRTRLGDTLTGAQQVILVGEPLRKHFAQFAPNADRFQVVPNGYYLPPNLPMRKKATPGCPLRIISISHLREGKGIDLNLHALAELSRMGYTGWTYAIVGDGPQRNELERMTAEFNMSQRVRFHGMLPHPTALGLLSEADVFLLPSYREAFGVANLEAMAVGLVSVGVQGQGPGDFIRHGATGLLVPPKDVHAIALLLRELIESPAMLEQIAEKGRVHARASLTWERSAKKLVQVYDSVLQGRSA